MGPIISKALTLNGNVQQNDNDYDEAFVLDNLWSSCPDPKALLQDQPDGTYLIHKGKDNSQAQPFTIFLKREGKARSVTIKSQVGEEGATLYSTGGDRWFPTLEDIIKRKSDTLSILLEPPKVEGQSLGNEISNDEEESQTRLGVRRRTSKPSIDNTKSVHAAPVKQSEQDLRKLAYYVGLMDSTEAARVLKPFELGTFLVRKNYRNQFRITVRKEGERPVLHLEVHFGSTLVKLSLNDKYFSR
jgi:hypothetical protein